MHAHIVPTTPPTGARRLSLEMLEVRQRADQFQGCRAGTAKPLRYLAAFQEAEPYLGLPPLAYKLVAWLVKQTMPCDWEAGSRPIAWPSADRQAEFLNLSRTRVKMLNRMLFEAGIFVIRDNPQGKRYGRRGPDGRIIQAFGFDLSPLAQRYDEFVRIAAAARAERRQMKELRQRVTLARRGITQLAELVPTPLPPAWLVLTQEAAELVATARRHQMSCHLVYTVEALETRLWQAEALIQDVRNAVNPDPERSVCGPHNISTNKSSNPLDTVIAAEKSSRLAPELAPEPEPLPPPHPQQRLAGIERPAQLLDLFPRLAAYVEAQQPAWADLIEAAYMGLRAELGVSPSAWAGACQHMGREGATIALGIVSTKPPSHFVRGPGGYFAGMVRKAEKGELYLERSLWGLRQLRYGKMPSRSVK